MKIAVKYTFRSTPLGTVNSATMNSEFTTAPMMIHGRNLPHRPRVLSTTNPIAGSVKASKMRAKSIRPPTNAAGTFATSIMKYVA